MLVCYVKLDEVGYVLATIDLERDVAIRYTIQSRFVAFLPTIIFFQTA